MIILLLLGNSWAGRVAMFNVVCKLGTYLGTYIFFIEFICARLLAELVFGASNGNRFRLSFIKLCTRIVSDHNNLIDNTFRIYVFG